MPEQQRSVIAPRSTKSKEGCHFHIQYMTDSAQYWPPHVSPLVRLCEHIKSQCFACITQCHLVTLKRGLFGGSAALLSSEWVVNCRGAACVFLLRHNAV